MNTRRRVYLVILGFLLLAAGLYACSPSAPTSLSEDQEPQAIATNAAQSGASSSEAGEPSATLPIPQPTLSEAALPTPTPIIEARKVDLEWPAEMHLGDSDSVRLRLLPDGDDYRLEAEFPEHAIEGESLPIERPNGYSLSAIAVLDGVGFELSPVGEQVRQLPIGKGAVWQWTLSPRAAGQQRLTVSLSLRWTPGTDGQGDTSEAVVFARGLDVKVSSFLGLTGGQARSFGWFGLVFGGGLSLGAILWRPHRLKPILIERPESAALNIEPSAHVNLDSESSGLLRALFNRYGRLTLVDEFLSGYSGSRTLLVQPIHTDGRSEALTIVKLGDRQSIEQEFERYERYVKDSLPPMTARIQHPPVSLRGSMRAAMQYTFLAEPGARPDSLRESLLADPNPTVLRKLYDTFGPGWWMQRHPYTFRLAQEYDRCLPPHLVLIPVDERPDGQLPGILHENLAPSRQNYQTGELVWIEPFHQWETRSVKSTLTFTGFEQPGQPAIRLRWLSPQPPRRRCLARVVATRYNLLTELGAGLDRCGMVDPLESYPALLDETVQGTRSILHGDLNVENILIGPGGFVWLIDFAQTREGHTLVDFTHLEVDLITRVIAPGLQDGREILDILSTNSHPLLNQMNLLCQACLFNPAWQRELYLARYFTALGALKYSSLDSLARQAVFAAAAWWASLLR